MINLETPKKIRPLIDQAHQVAMNMLRPISRKYDEGEHSYPKELDMLAAMIDGITESGANGGAGASGVRRSEKPQAEKGNRNGANLASVLSVMEMCWGDVGLLLSMPRQGLGNSAIASVATDEQLERFAGTWAAMAITEPGVGSDSGNIKTTATKDGDEYVINGEKIYVTSGDRADSVVVWATLDREPRPRSDQVLRGPQGQPRHARGAARAQARHPRLRHRGDHLRRLPRARRGPPRLAGDRPQAGLRRRDGDLRQHPPAGRGDGASAAPGPRST